MKFIICGNYGAGNIGDEMILKGMLETVKSADPYAEITIFSGNPKETSKTFKTQSVEYFPSGIRSLFKFIFSKNKTKEEVEECDYFILGGGGLFGSLTFKANLIWGIQAFMAYHYKKPVLMYGQSVGELKGWIRKWIVKKLFRKAYLVAVRDEESKKRLRSVGVTEKIYVIPDLAFRTSTVPFEDSEKKEVVVALRQSKNISQEFISSVTDFLNWLIKDRKWGIKMIDFQQTGQEMDKRIHKKLAKNLPTSVGYTEKPTTIKEIENAFSKTGIILGMRLHSIIEAIKTTTPFIAISYAPKVEDFLKDACLSDYMIKRGDINSEKLKSLFRKVIKNQKKIKNKLERLNKESLEKHHEMEEVLRKELKG